jgi:hypothetical protein
MVNGELQVIVCVSFIISLSDCWLGGFTSYQEMRLTLKSVTAFSIDGLMNKKRHKKARALCKRNLKHENVALISFVLSREHNTAPFFSSSCPTRSGISCFYSFTRAYLRPAPVYTLHNSYERLFCCLSISAFLPPTS